MSDNVNVYITNWKKTDEIVQVNKWTANLTVQWQDNSNQPREWTGLITFPNDLILVPSEWLKEELCDLLLKVARKRLGI